MTRTNRTDRILAYLRAYIAEHGGGPTYREIQAACDIPSTSGVAYHLAKLEAAGQITIQRSVGRRSSRGIRLAAGGPEQVLVIDSHHRYSTAPPHALRKRIETVVDGRSGRLVFIPDADRQALGGEA